MVRLAVPKRDRAVRKRGMLGMSGQLSGITRFSDITALTGGEGQVRACSQHLASYVKTFMFKYEATCSYHFYPPSHTAWNHQTNQQV